MKTIIHKLKFKFVMTKIYLLMALVNHYNDQENAERAAEVGKSLDKEVDTFLKGLNVETVDEKKEVKPELVKPAPAKVETAKAEPAKAETAKTEIAKEKPVDNAPAVPAPKKDAPAPAREAEKPVEVEDAPEAIEEIRILYPFSVKRNGKVEEVRFKHEIVKILVAFPTLKDDEVKAIVGDAFPTTEEFEMVLDEAWEMLCAGVSNKEVNVLLKKELGRYYPKLLKSDSDYYTYFTNPMSKIIAVIKRMFGKDLFDKNIIVTRPGWSQILDDGTLVLDPENDMYIPKPSTTKAADTKAPAKVEDKPVEKKEMVTVQDMDEEAQENETVEDEPIEEAEVVDETPEDETPAVEESQTDATPEVEDEAKPPLVNKFEQFNQIETVVFQTLRDGYRSAKNEEDKEYKSQILREATQDARDIISLTFEGEAWAQKDENGKHTPVFMKYWNDILKAIGENHKK